MSAGGEGWEGIWPGETQILSDDACFLCGVSLDDATRTDEDVFPKWLLGEFNQWNGRLTLLNGSLIKYSQMKIPCCSTCNNEYLSRIENTVRSAYIEGFDGFEALDRDVLFLWLAKIVYGILFREMSLAIDIRDRDAGTITDPAFLEQFRMHHYLLQGAVGRVTWDGNPASILLYRTMVSSSAERNFDFSDGPFGPFLSLRLGSIGIIAVLQDWGALEAYAWAQLDRAKTMELAPLQFRELMAIGRYWAYKFNRVPKYLVDQRDGRGHVMVMPLGGLSGGLLWDDFDHDEFAHMLAGTLGVSVDRVQTEGLMMTWLRDDADNPVLMPFDAWYE